MVKEIKNLSGREYVEDFHNTIALDPILSQDFSIIMTKESL
jgi:hypothetical protein